MPKKPATKDKCVPQFDEHDGYHDTGRRGKNPRTGDTYEVWRCQCDKNKLDRYPGM